MRVYNNSLEAWEGLNESFLRNDDWLEGNLRGGCIYAYNLTIFIRKPELNPEFDFGKHFNYSTRKWSMLVNNYIEPNQLKDIKAMIDEAEASKAHAMKFYNLSYKFDSNHSNSKGCLTSMILSRRGEYNGKPSRNMTVILRASEVTKRLIVDLLLFQRIGEYIWGNQEWSLTIHFNQIFNDDNVLLMYHAHKNIKNILNRSESVDPLRRKQILDKLNKLLATKVEDMPYKIYKRVITVLRKDLYTTPVTLAKDCYLSLETVKKKKKKEDRDFMSDIVCSKIPGEFYLKMTNNDNPTWESSISLSLEDLKDIQKSIEYVLSTSK